MYGPSFYFIEDFYRRLCYTTFKYWLKHGLVFEKIEIRTNDKKNADAV